MPPHAVAENESGGLSGLTEYSDRLEGGAAVKLTREPQVGVADFKPVKPLGNGDMGNVYLVAQRNNNAPYAMKVMKKEVLRARKNGHRAQTEREILSALNHPFFPVLHYNFEDEKHLFLVMSYCHGGDLNVLRQRQPDKKFSESACRFYVAEVLLALEYLHKKKIVYRDLKPENILIQPTGHIMLTDFDLSLDLSERKWTRSTSVKAFESLKKEKKLSRVRHVKAFFACGSPTVLAKKPSSKKKSPNARVTPEEFHLTRKAGSGKRSTDGPANSFVGTEEYVAPEIVWGKGHGLAVDWWTLGVLLYELYYGKTPFKGANRKETFYSILCKTIDFTGASADMADLMRKLLVKEPENRLGSRGGAEEIKKHPFFSGVNWEELPNLSRTPVLPDPFSWEQIEKQRQAKAKATGKPLKTNWSFTQPSDPAKDSKLSKSPSGPLSLKSNDSQEDVTPTPKTNLKGDELHAQEHSERVSLLKEEVREAKALFGDVF